MNIDLRVKVPKKFKKNLYNRFNPDNAASATGKFWVIAVPCKLCTSFPGCDDCPFNKFQSAGATGVVGCNEFMLRLLDVNARELKFKMPFSRILWDAEDNPTACKQLRLLRERAEKLITWI